MRKINKRRPDLVGEPFHADCINHHQGECAMIEFIRKSFDDPDDVMEYPGAKLALVRLGGIEVWRMIAEAGWRYSESMDPVDGTESCPAEHPLLDGHLRAARYADGRRNREGVRTR